MRRSRCGRRPQHRVVTQSDAEIVVPTGPVSADHHERSRFLPIATAVCAPSHRAPESTKPLSSAPKGSGAATGGLCGQLRGAVRWVAGFRRPVSTDERSAVANPLVGSPVHQRAADTTNAASRTAVPPKARRLPIRTQRGGACFRCRPRSRECVADTRAGDQVRCRHSASCTGWAAHSARHDPLGQRMAVPG